MSSTARTSSWQRCAGWSGAGRGGAGQGGQFGTAWWWGAVCWLLRLPGRAGGQCGACFPGGNAGTYSLLHAPVRSPTPYPPAPLTKVDVDRNPRLVRRFNIDRDNLPAIYLFRDRKARAGRGGRAGAGRGGAGGKGWPCGGRRAARVVHAGYTTPHSWATRTCAYGTPCPPPPAPAQMYVVPQSAHSQEGLREFLLRGYEAAHSQVVPPDHYTPREMLAALRSHLVSGRAGGRARAGGSMSGWPARVSPLPSSPSPLPALASCFCAATKVLAIAALPVPEEPLLRRSAEPAARAVPARRACLASSSPSCLRLASWRPLPCKSSPRGTRPDRLYVTARKATA